MANLATGCVQAINSDTFGAATWAWLATNSRCLILYSDTCANGQSTTLFMADTISMITPQLTLGNLGCGSYTSAGDPTTSGTPEP